MIILGLDPGLWSGFAVLDARLHSIALIGAGQYVDATALPRLLDSVIIEKPVAYPHSTTPPNDLITLAIQAGRYAERFKDCKLVSLVAARTWKGQVPKLVTMARVLKALPEAQEFLDPYPMSLRHNVSDAIGLALWEAQRMGLGRIA